MARSAGGRAMRRRPENYGRRSSCLREDIASPRLLVAVQIAQFARGLVRSRPDPADNVVNCHYELEKSENKHCANNVHGSG